MKVCGADTKKPADGCNSAPTLCMNDCIHPFKDRNLADTPGKRVGVVGPRGLGHVAVRFGKAFGRHVTVISTYAKEKEATDRPVADDFIAARRSLDFIVDTVSAQLSRGAMLELLKVAVLGASDKPIEPPAFPLILGKRSATGSMTRAQRIERFGHPP
uniref:D-isomer specific 2-hydroxyacid dehydrogenase NAD-binding domain-containing protein n=1 Tax=Populus trichocarpa TaxID=3694 RepID=B9H518_POPTR